MRICSAKLYNVGAVLRVKVSNNFLSLSGATFMIELTILEVFLDRGQLTFAIVLDDGERGNL